MAQIGQLPIGIFDEGGKFEPKQEFIDAARAQALEEGKKYIGDATGFEKFKDALFDIPDATIALVSGTAETLSEFALGLAKETLKGAQLSTTADPEKIKEIRESPGFTSYFDQLNFPRSNIYDSKISGVTPTDVAEFTGEVLAPVPAGIFAAGARFVPSLFKTAKVVKTQPLDDIIDIYTNASRRSERMALRSATKNDESLNNFIKTINELPAQKKSKTGERFGSAITDQTRYDENIIKQFANIHNSHNPFKIEYLKQSLGNQYKGLYNSARDKDLLSTNLKFKGEDITVQNILEKGKGKIKGDVSQDDILQQIEDVLIRYKKENPSSTGYELKVGGDFNLMKYIEEVNPNLATYLGNKKKSTYYNLIEALKTEGVLDNIGLPELTKMGVKTGTNVKKTVEGVAKQQPRSGKMELEQYLNFISQSGDTLPSNVPIKYLPGLFKFSQKATGPEKKTQIIMAHGIGTGRIPKVIEDKINLIPNRFLKEVERPTFFLTSAGNRAHQKIENRLIPALIDKYELLGWKHSGKAGDDWVNVKKVDVSKDKELATKINELDDVINANREKLEKLDAYTLFYNPVKDKLVSYGKDISEIPGLSNLINKVKSGEKKLTGKIDVDRLKQGGIVGMKFMTRPLDGQR
jgi:hypothetical protein